MVFKLRRPGDSVARKIVEVNTRRRGVARVVFRGPLDGQVWSGIGPCPGWLERLIDAGQDPADLLEPGARLPPAFARASTAGPGSRAGVFRCPKSGATWTGRGYQPAWVRNYLKAGKQLEALLAPGAAMPDRFRDKARVVSRKAAGKAVTRRVTSPSRKKIVFLSPDGRESWNGKGQQPVWFQNHLRSKGHKPSDLLAPDAVLPDRFLVRGEGTAGGQGATAAQGKRGTRGRTM